MSTVIWDITDSGVILTPLTAKIASGSSLVEAYPPSTTHSPTDLSSECAFRSDSSAGSSALGPLGSFCIGAVGGINLGLDTFRGPDRFDTSTNLFGPESANGIEASIVGPNVDFGLDGFTNTNNQPLVQNQMVFTFLISGSLSGITNVQLLFGTDGATLVIPEPTTVILLGLGMLGLGVISRRRKRSA